MTRNSQNKSKTEQYESTGDDSESDQSEQDPAILEKAIEIDERLGEINRKYAEQRNIWIVKPGENTNRGTGINVCSDLSEIRSLVLSSHSDKGDP